MKKILTLVTVLAMSAPAVFAAGNHPMGGCGLGYMLLGNDDNSKLMQILAATTNGTSGNQTFGMTSGTSGCTEDGAVRWAKEAEVFAEVNLDTLRLEMAAGQGEFVTTFATLLGANEAQAPKLVKLFQDEYKTLFPSAGTTSAEMLENLSGLLS